MSEDSGKCMPERSHSQDKESTECGSAITSAQSKLCILVRLSPSCVHPFLTAGVLILHYSKFWLLVLASYCCHNKLPQT
jgi:hypothetical protein